MSSPKYHRENCVFYDVYGNLKNKENILESLLNQRVKELIDEECPFVFKLSQKGNLYQAELLDRETNSQAPIHEFVAFFNDKLEKISSEIFDQTGDIISFD